MEHNFVMGQVNIKDVDTLFGGDQDITTLVNKVDMFDILVMADIFTSKSQAHKNWTRTGRDVPDGFTDIQNIGKFNQRLTIWRSDEK